VRTFGGKKLLDKNGPKLYTVRGHNQRPLLPKKVPIKGCVILQKMFRLVITVRFYYLFPIDDLQKVKIEDLPVCEKDSVVLAPSSSNANAVVPTGLEGFNLYSRKEESFEAVMEVRRKHMQRHFDDLTSCYFSNRVQKVLFPPETTPGDDEDGANGGFYEFSNSLNNFTR
jgi:hypothetical protein